MARKLVFVALVLVIGVTKIESSQDAIKKITYGFFKNLNQCIKELNLPDHIATDLNNFWKEDYSLVDRDTGCVLLCLSNKVNLFDEKKKLHHENTHRFFKGNGADDVLVSKLADLLYECEKQFVDVADDCVRKLKLTKCFQTEVRRSKWAPVMDVITEAIRDVKV